MSKTKNKSHSEVENYRGIIREYQKEIKSLRKQLRQYEKYDRPQTDTTLSVDIEDPKLDSKMKKNCQSCGKGKMVETLNLGSRGIFGECGHCGEKGKMQ